MQTDYILSSPATPSTPIHFNIFVIYWVNYENNQIFIRDKSSYNIFSIQEAYYDTPMAVVAKLKYCIIFMS